MHVARVGEKRTHVGFWWRNLKERNHLERPGRVWEDDIQGVRARGIQKYMLMFWYLKAL
jgi:hypothetical protein